MTTPAAPRAAFRLPWETDAPTPVHAAAPAAPVAPAYIPGVGNKIDPLLYRLIELEGSDLHLQADMVPHCRIHGTMVDLPGYEDVIIGADELADMLFEMVGPKKQAQFVAEWDLDTAYGLNSEHRFRVNFLRDRGKVGAVLRVIPSRIKPTVAPFLAPERPPWA